ncbi:uncharacterized protein BP5553_10495 [Venustampulla echinocandica]|uniref:Uncharacterized protein n=1 Tax=Venustampulla echinocandica TaxID=2656787 RepID=A0A370T9G2_9HELO|nr:uncharacterized protein BP5553_10495 [Venustampulla echinocandica]RDL30217.1 hypothetical protein BP5553_10495 [Venustampulla echinocandica]
METSDAGPRGPMLPSTVLGSPHPTPLNLSAAGNAPMANGNVDWDVFEPDDPLELDIFHPDFFPSIFPPNGFSAAVSE